MAADSRRAHIVAALKKKPPKQFWDGGSNVRVPKMPGPNDPGPRYKKTPGVLGPKAAKNGAYFIPGLGDAARNTNVKRNRKANTNPFNPGRGGGTYS